MLSRLASAVPPPQPMHYPLMAPPQTPTITTLLPVTAIFLLGGATLKEFSLALIVGFILGSYSSIFVASSLLSWWRENHPQQASALPDSAQDEEDDRTRNGIIL